MEEALALIDQLIEEHKQILQDIQTTERIANDAGALLELGRAEEDFMPGRFDDQERSLQSLQESLEAVDQAVKRAGATAFTNRIGLYRPIIHTRRERVIAA